MADFVDREASEDDSEVEDELDQHERKRLKRVKAMSDSEEEEEDDEEKIREDMKDLIDDRPIEESDSSDGESDASGPTGKRKKSDDDSELDDRLEDEDYELIEENLGVKVERKRFKRLKRITDEESDDDEKDESMDKHRLEGALFDHSDEDEERREERSQRQKEQENFDEEMSDESDADDFIVDDYGNSISEKKKKRKPVFTDAALQEGQDIFGVDFDYDEFDKYDEDDYEDESGDEDEYEDDDVEHQAKKTSRKKVTKKSIFDIYEPSELKRGHFTDRDNVIRKTDIPERMQLRDVPITSIAEGSTELDDEAEWIFKHAFQKPTITKIYTENYNRKTSSAIGKIKKALDFIRNQHMEVPFIAFYRKEYVQPELSTKDLWKIYKFDAKWCMLQSRKRALVKLFEKVQVYQMNKIMEKPDEEVPSEMRLVRDDDINSLKCVQTSEELRDIHDHFLLHCSPEIDVVKTQETEKKRLKHRKQQEEKLKERINTVEQEIDMLRGEEVASEEDEDRMKILEEELASLKIKSQELEDEPIPLEETVKVSRDTGPYARCRKAGMLGFAKLFGLTPEQFAENLRDSYQKHEVEQEPLDPYEAAGKFLSQHFTTIDEVLEAAKFVVARQIAREPLLRKSVREIYFERAKLSVRPTKKGAKEIDEFHNCYTMKYLKDKMVRDLRYDDYMKLKIAEQDKLLTVTIADSFEGNTSNNFLDEIKQLYYRDEFAQHVQNWNKLRSECVELALNKMVIPDLRKELDAQLQMEAKEYVLDCCGKKVHSWIRTAPFDIGEAFDDNDEWSSPHGFRVLGIAYVPDLTQAAFGAMVNEEGEVTDYLRLSHITKRKNANNRDEAALKDSDLDILEEFILNKKPHVIAIAGESREAITLQTDIRELIEKMVDDSGTPRIQVEIIDNDFARIYSNSKKGEAEFREYPPLLRQAISVARRLRDPLVEFSQLCSADEEILCLRYHPMQDNVAKEDLLDIIYQEFINRTNEVGVDINLAVQNSLTINLVQFICGLGPRKGQALIKILKQTNQRLENRTQLVTLCHMGPKVFVNCSGFIKIDTNSLGDSTETYVEVLDGSRVHPETYDWARKMAVDALEYDDDGNNPASALDEILESPDRLKDLDLDAFAIELEKQGFGNKGITLYDIREELESRYRDKRDPYEPPTPEQLFDMLTKESSETFYVGKLISATVSGITHRKPNTEQLDSANPARNEETELWQCPFCFKSDFPKLNDVWDHFDAQECPGTAVGVKLRLDNGLFGFIHLKNLSDKHVKNPEERVRPGMPIHVRVIKIQVDKFNVDCTSKTSDLLDKNKEQQWRPAKDEYYDQEAEDADMKKESDAKKVRSQQQYTKRVIAHPAFRNISYAQAIKELQDAAQGDVIVRPSSKSSDHLTATWKVTDGIYQHIDIREVGKENSFSIGSSLFIGNEEFEDIEEIISRHISPMAGYARDLITFKYYNASLDGLRDKAEAYLKEEKKKNPTKIHYFISASKSYPGKFMISYQPRANCRHEYVSVTPDGFKYRQKMFDNVNSFTKWFKEHFKDPLPSQTPMSTPRGSTSRSSYPTPGLSVHNDTIQRVAQNLPNSMFNTLAQAATNTPHYPQSQNTPYTPSGQTPFIMMTPHSSQTPKYGTPTQQGHSGFLRPGQPISTTSRSGQPTYRASPYSTSASPRVSSHQQQHRRPHQEEEEDWDRADMAWGKRGDASKSAPKNFPPPRHDEFNNMRKTPNYEMERPPSRSSIGGRSIRSTPRTNASPRSMMMGDSTPLYDEN